MRVSKIEQQKKNPQRISVYVDDNFAFGINKRDLLELGIVVGTMLNNEELAQLKNYAADSKYIDMAIAWALRRSHSAREIDTYIAKKTTSPQLADKIEDKLCALGFVDDENFANSWYEARRRKGYSSYQIKGELLKKGVDISIINAVINSEDEVEALKKLAIKKSRLTRYKDKKKLTAYLLRKGYRYPDVAKAVEEV